MRISLTRLGRMVRKELVQMLRDPRMRLVIFVSPMIQLVVLGYAVSTDVRDAPIAVVDRDRTTESRELIDRFTASGYSRVVALERGEGIEDAVERGAVLLGIEIPPNFSVDLTSGRGADVQVLLDGTDSNTGTIALGYLQGIMRQFVRDLAGEGAEHQPGVVLVSRAWYNPNLESRVYNVPGVMGALLLLITMLLTALGVVREREIGTWEQLVVSPVTPTELMLGKTLPVVLIGLIDLILVSALIILWFGIALRGSFVVLLGGAVPFLAAGLAIGLLISTVSKTQQEAFMSMFLVLLPAIIFSGILFPISSMPPGFRFVTLFNPLRHFIEIVRAVFLKGAGVPEMAGQISTLVAMAVVGLALAVRRFRAMIT